MQFRPTLFFALLLSLTSIAIGGAWGTGSFDNDDALDWVWELEESSGSSAIENALHPVATSNAYIEAPSGSYAIAAAEALAALMGKPSESLPPEVTSWVKSQSFKPSAELLNMARSALANVSDESRSELAQLWKESGTAYDEWREHLAGLSERLR